MGEKVESREIGTNFIYSSNVGHFYNLKGGGVTSFSFAPSSPQISDLAPPSFNLISENAPVCRIVLLPLSARGAWRPPLRGPGSGGALCPSRADPARQADRGTSACNSRVGIALCNHREWEWTISSDSMRACCTSPTLD